MSSPIPGPFVQPVGPVTPPALVYGQHTAIGKEHTFQKDSKDQQKSLELLLEQPSGPVPLTTQEKERIKAEYVTLQHFEKDIEIKLLKQNTKFQQEELWYNLLSNEEYFSNCLLVNE